MILKQFYKLKQRRGKPRLCWISNAKIIQQLELGTQPSRSKNLL